MRLNGRKTTAVREIDMTEFHTKEFYAEGNNGGDNISIVLLDDDRVILKVGHCCVYTIDHIVPVEFLTAALTRAVDHEGGIAGFIESIGWNTYYTRRLIGKVVAHRQGDNFSDTERP